MPSPQRCHDRLSWYINMVHRFDLVRFHDIADWLAYPPGALKPDEGHRAEAYHRLRQAILRGEFDTRPGKPAVVLLMRDIFAKPGRVFLRLQGERFIEWSGFDQEDDLWAPRPLIARWFAARGIDPPPWLDGNKRIRFRSRSGGEHEIWIPTNFESTKKRPCFGRREKQIEQPAASELVLQPGLSVRAVCESVCRVFHLSPSFPRKRESRDFSLLPLGPRFRGDDELLQTDKEFALASA